VDARTVRPYMFIALFMRKQAESASYVGTHGFIHGLFDCYKFSCVQAM